ncbi:hypothetical protein EHQ53_00160 [Leptospira langatensis]|uniref:Uncharacterized protein n=1 Tax=Leptospira langatensis TaxID=2484983 RepID=A0A5F2A0F7_9LEPT|nr:hypothetical protein EHO57_16305 [Leptospira langatensis]TGL43793.1 hypothetical protein EHQ53_00160 [Leptospira langatensis]
MHVPRTLPDPHLIQENWNEIKYLAYDPAQDWKSENLEIEYSQEDPKRFVNYRDIFTTWTGWGRDYENLYGPVTKLLAKEFKDNPEEYFGKTKILIRKFHLESVDHCIYNSVNVEFEADVISNGISWNYNFKDGIESEVSDCMTVLATLPVLTGWIVYLPYIGYRGSREDQLNQMGRVAMLDFLDEWKKRNPKPTDKKGKAK